MTQIDVLNLCAERVETGDPDRFLAAMAAPVPMRAGLLLLAAVNLEIARAPWASKEPLIAQMRLQFWRDVIEGRAVAGHELAQPLLDLIDGQNLSKELLLKMVDARDAEIGTQAPFDDTAALWRYFEDGAGALMALSLEAVVSEDLSAARRDCAVLLGSSLGLSNYLMAIPALEAAGRIPLPDGRPEGIAELAQEGLARFQRAKDGLRDLPRTHRPAILSAWRVSAILTQAEKTPSRVAAGALGQSEFNRRGSLLWQSLLGLR